MTNTIINLNKNNAKEYVSYLKDLYDNMNIQPNIFNNIIIYDSNYEKLQIEAYNVAKNIKEVFNVISYISESHLVNLRLFVLSYIVYPLVLANKISEEYITNVKLYKDKLSILNLIKDIVSRLS